MPQPRFVKFTLLQTGKLRLARDAIFAPERIGPRPGAIEAAVRSVAARFPFDHYMIEPFDAYVNVANVVSDYVPVGARILDFGAGPCDKLAVLAELGYTCTAYDDLQDPWHRNKRDEIMDFASRAGIRYCRPGGPSPWNGQEEFDLIMLHDVLEHLHDSPRELLVELLGAIRPNGYLFITVPNAVNIRKRLAVLIGRTNLPPFDQYWWSPAPWRGHVREYTEGDLRSLARYLEVSPLRLEGCHHMLGQVPAPLRTMYRAVTRGFGGWRDSWMLVAQKPEGWRPRLAPSHDTSETRG